ncbi:MAG: preprotein translocase subunit YajC [Bacteroidales bacterium]|jgi:preprotein translocase subunit YajC|nr:preprotein translocase subunit YajC [Bacteroidales bacterium]
MLNSILLEAPQGQGGGMGSMLLIIAVLFLFMWLMGGSQRKQAKKEQEFRSKMQKGDRVIFSGGIYGKVSEVGDTTVDVEVGNGIILTVEKNMIQPAPETKTADAKK